MKNDRSTSRELSGLMFIGDPHLESRVPGFRKDDYPTVALRKFRWCLEYAAENSLQPFLLGDLFQLPQDNPNWLISELISIIGEYSDGSLPAIYGNHDVRENSLKQNDSISILFAGGHLQKIGKDDRTWTGVVAGASVVVGGTVWGKHLPKRDTFAEMRKRLQPDLSVWMTHHDILIPGYEEGGRIRPYSIDGVDVVINGHIHRRLDVVSKEKTHWVTAGNITRRSRNDASRSHVPAIPCIFLDQDRKDVAPHQDNCLTRRMKPASKRPYTRFHLSRSKSLTGSSNGSVFHMRTLRTYFMLPSRTTHLTTKQVLNSSKTSVS